VSFAAIILCVVSQLVFFIIVVVVVVVVDFVMTQSVNFFGYTLAKCKDG
jgi:archaellum component FlaG (FlaF/FlaG flagellin family)